MSFVGVDKSPAIIAQAQQIMSNHFWLAHQDFFTAARLTVFSPTARGKGRTELGFALFFPLQKCGPNQRVKLSQKGPAGHAHTTLSALFRSAEDALADKAQKEVKAHPRGSKTVLQHTASAA